MPEGMLPNCYPADHPGGDFTPKWPLWFIMQLEEYLERSGDREMVEDLREPGPESVRLFPAISK